MSAEHEKGDIDVRMAAGKFTGSFRSMVTDVNEMIDGHIAVKKKTMACVAEFSKGNFDAPLERFAGKKAFINDTIERLRSNMKSFIAEMHRMSNEHNQGDIDVVIPGREVCRRFPRHGAGRQRYGGRPHFGQEKGDGVRGRVRQGQFRAHRWNASPARKSSSTTPSKSCAATCKSFITEMNRMSDEHTKGDIDVQIPTAKFAGDFRTMAQGVNDMVAGHISVKKKAMACVAEFGRGNFDAPLERFPGKKAFINDTIEQVRVHLKNLIADTDLLIGCAADGKLDFRADASRHLGDFAKIVQGINRMSGRRHRARERGLGDPGENRRRRPRGPRSGSVSRRSCAHQGRPQQDGVATCRKTSAPSARTPRRWPRRPRNSPR